MFVTNQKLEMNMPQIFKTKCIQISENIEPEKKFRFGGVKVGKIIYNRKHWRTDSIILGTRMSLEWVVSVV